MRYDGRSMVCDTRYALRTAFADTKGMKFRVLRQSA